MAKRKHKHEEHVNHERWLISYADFITLLFAFFVVMYALSSLNEGKYKELSKSLNTAFEGKQRMIESIQLGQTPSLDSIIPLLEQASASDQVNSENDYEDQTKGEEKTEENAGLLQTIRAGLDLEAAQALVSVKQNAEWIEFQLASDILFSPGSEKLQKKSDIILGKIALFLMKTNGFIQVRGFSDNRPIYNELFPSNWELSCARAASVVRRLIAFGVSKERLCAIGFSENFSIADNDLESGRRRNRRVSIAVSKKTFKQFYNEIFP